MLIYEVLNPFYLFQAFSVCLWFWDEYEKYACCILAISIAGVAESLYATVTNINKIRKMAEYKCQLEVKRTYEGNARLAEMSSEVLVPGDIVIIPDNFLMPCDVVLLAGSCIVNEAMLTGESVPVVKNALQPCNQEYDP